MFQQFYMEMMVITAVVGFDVQQLVTMAAPLYGDDGIQRLMLVSATLYGDDGDHNRCWVWCSTTDDDVSNSIWEGW